MHRPAAPFGKRDLFSNLRVRLSPVRPRSGHGSFSIRDQLNQESDYFGMKPIHGSSPAGSLAADLCQNFSIGEETRYGGFSHRTCFCPDRQGRLLTLLLVC